jgi:hypothetical protein
MHAVTSKNDKVLIIGFVHREWTVTHGDWNEIMDNHKVFDDYSNRDFKVLAIILTALDKQKEKTISEFHLYNPNDLKVVSEASLHKS